ncbi:RusA family crossover junction endodeoxyribonuclease [Variovorax sp. 278MFTsu5.1]|uniref:RusA family crossover junction endodeoxyribonuclease n=1 Tax=Variovorax sp. 278MFTsu5.1 TaxID=3158366 RepID=UPI003AAE21A6
MQVSFVVPGEPVPKGRPRFGRGRAYTPEATRDFAEWVEHHARVAMRGKEPLSGPLALSFSAVYPIPSSWSKRRKEAALLLPEWKPTRPDIDNLEKALCDACNSIVYRDDGQIVCLRNCTKVWGAEPRLVVVLEELQP